MAFPKSARSFLPLKKRRPSSDYTRSLNNRSVRDRPGAEGNGRERGDVKGGGRRTRDLEIVSTDFNT